MKGAYIIRAVHLAVTPVSLLVDSCHTLPKARILKSKKHAHCAVGIVLMLSGSALATHPVTFVPHFLWDAVCYLLHGYGSLPVVRVLCGKFNLETIVDEEAEIKREIKQLQTYESRRNQLHKQS